jgi:hypothetical protein
MILAPPMFTKDNNLRRNVRSVRHRAGPQPTRHPPYRSSSMMMAGRSDRMVC